jgi:3-oxoacyl-[acyl-carrier protein] reductase
MKNILITGVSRGLGLELSKSLLINGNTVYGVSRTVTPELTELLLNYPNNFFHIVGDLELYEEMSTTINKFLISNKIKIDSFVNNAAIAYDDIISNINPNKL